jgi:hypothetical protein
MTNPAVIATSVTQIIGALTAMFWAARADNREAKRQIGRAAE